MRVRGIWAMVIVAILNRGRAVSGAGEGRHPGGGDMQFQVSHEVLFELTIEADSLRDAEARAAGTPYEHWRQRYVVREACVPVEESPLTPELE